MIRKDFGVIDVYQVGQNAVRVEGNVVVIGGYKSVTSVDILRLKGFEVSVGLILAAEVVIGHRLLAAVFHQPEIGIAAPLEYLFETLVDAVGRGDL